MTNEQQELLFKAQQRLISTPLLRQPKTLQPIEMMPTESVSLIGVNLH